MAGDQLHKLKRSAGEILLVAALHARVLRRLPLQPRCRAWLRILLAGVAELQHLHLQPGHLRPCVPLHSATPFLPVRKRARRQRPLCLRHKPLRPARQPLLLHPLHGLDQHGSLPAHKVPDEKPPPAETESGPGHHGPDLAGGERGSLSVDNPTGAGLAGTELDPLRGFRQS